MKTQFSAALDQQRTKSFHSDFTHEYKMLVESNI
jgi:hypothetical protein